MGWEEIVGKKLKEIWTSWKGIKMEALYATGLILVSLNYFTKNILF